MDIHEDEEEMEDETRESGDNTREEKGEMRK